MNEDKAREAFEAPAKTVQRWMSMVDYAYQCRDDIRSSSGETPRSGELRLLAEEMRAALQWAASQQAAEGDDELHRLRAKVDALTREAWTWSKACESESMRIHGVKDAINKAYGLVSKEHPWTPEHSKNYPQQAANIINAAMTIFVPPSTQGGADDVS